MSASLTSHDVARLLAEPSADLRAELAAKLAAELTASALTPGETALAADIVRILSRDVEASVRASLAHGLRHSPNLPHDVALKLAADIDAVAMPLLTDSLVLTEADLVEIVRHGSASKHETIAGRTNLTEAVSGALITHAAEPAITKLMANDSAAIGAPNMDRAVTRFAASDPVKQAMVQRADLPVTVAERLVAMVSLEWQTRLVERHALPPGAAADILLGSREQAILHLSAGASDDSLRRMVAQMQGNGRLTPTLMLRALCTGDIAFFEAALAAKGDVKLENAQLLIHDPSRRGLEALYHKADLPADLYAAFKAAVEAVDETGFDGEAHDLERFRARVISRVLTAVDTIDPADADYLVGQLGNALVHAPAAA